MDTNDKCIKAIRALLTSSKNGLSVAEILNDFEQMEGKPVPFEACGFGSPEEMLRASNQFQFAGVKVLAKPSKESQHVRKLVQDQCPSGKPKKKTNSLMPQRSLRSSTADSQWNSTAYAKVYTEMPNRSVKKVSTHPAKLLQAAFSSSNGNSLPHKRLNANNSDEPPPLRPILKQSNIKPMPSAQSNDSKSAYGNGVQPPSRPHTGRTHPTNMPSQNPLRPPNRQQPDRMPKTGGEKTSVQSRLANVKKQISLDQIDFVAPQAPAAVPIELPILNPSVKPFVQQKRTPVLKFDEILQMAPINAIAMYCQQKEYAAPEYSVCRTKSRNFTCKVTVGKAMFSSYPNEFATQAEAQHEAARIAMQHIQQTEYTDRLPICMDLDAEIANKIFDSLDGNGVFLKFIPEIFQKKYEQVLPGHWESIIRVNPQMFSIVEDSVTERVYPNILDDSDDCRPDELQLPWGERHWNVYITSVSSTVEVWGRLIGPDYSTKLDSILDDTEPELLSGKPKQPCANLTVGKYCYITDPDCRTELHRVRIEKIDAATNRALCFLIDYGDQEWRPLAQIYDSEIKLFHLPAQAVRFSLYNLEDFAENPQAKHEIAEHLAGKTLIAEIKSSEAEYTVQCESSDMDAKVKAIFYDTSSDEDIQLNQVILRKICANAEPPQLKRSKWNSVHVTHISDDGDIYCQLHAETTTMIHNIRQLIHRLTINGVDRQYRIDAGAMADSVPTELCLVYDDGDDKWYRAAMLATQRPGGAAVDVKYVDYGMAKTVAREHIYRLDKLSTALCKYPHQAILVRLNNIEAYNARIVARLRGLLCANQPVLVQVTGFLGTIPVVTICKRLESQQSTILVKINDAIRMEQELEDSTDLLPSGDDSFISISSIRAKDKPTKLQFYPEPSLDGFFKVVVVTTPNPSNFFIRPSDEEKRFSSMMLALRERCNKNRNSLSTDEIEVNQFYAGQSSDGFWYRVKVQKILSDDQLVVYKCDFGSVDLLAADALRRLDAEFMRLPQLAIQAKAHGIQPKNSVWSIEDCARFQQQTAGKQFAAQIKAIRKDTTNNQLYILELVLIDVSKKNVDININDELVREQRAIQA